MIPVRKSFEAKPWNEGLIILRSGWRSDNKDLVLYLLADPFCAHGPRGRGRAGRRKKSRQKQKPTDENGRGRDREREIELGRGRENKKKKARSK